MRNQLMTLTGTLRAFDGYDRWDKTPIQEFGSMEELEILKKQLEAPSFLKRKYIDLVIREATEQETTRYHRQLQREVHKDQVKQKELEAQLQGIKEAIAFKNEKIQSIEQIKIPQ